MKGIIVKPEICLFDTVREFAEEFGLGERDLILTNQYLFDPFFGPLGLKCHTVFQERYGGGEPTDVMADAILKEAAKLDYDRIVAVGGGTVIDLAKVLCISGGKTTDELYEEKTHHAAKELIILPTTCGTGSEVTNIAILNRAKLGVKLGLTGEAMYASQAVLVPELLSSLPDYVFAASSIDALVHAVESGLSPKATEYTKLFGYRAIEMILGAYLAITDGIRRGEAPAEARKPYLKDLLIASNFAGLAFGTAGCGPVHAMSYPLGGKYHVPHGESNYAMFTGVLKHYLKLRNDGEIIKMNGFIAGILGCPENKVYDDLEELLNRLLPKKKLHEYGVTEEELDVFAASVIEQQQRLMQNSFVPLGLQDVREIYGTLL